MNTEQWILITLGLLFIKHWYVDFVNQSMEEVHGKGIYGNVQGIWHSAKQGIGTAIVFLIAGLDLDWVVMLAAVDFVLHYHIDWTKININKHRNYTIETPQFWAWLGADQLAHSLTYLALIYYALLS